MEDQNKVEYNEEINFFAETNFRNQRVKFGIKIDDRRRHMYLIGKTGMGKSTVIENMIIQDIYAGKGVAIVDPHGDTAEKIINFIPSNRINDVVYFNPGDVDYPLAFNILESVDSTHKHLVASGLVGVFKKMFAESWGPRLEYLLRNAILALLDFPGSTLLGIQRILVDKEFRKKVIVKITDPVVKSFWVDEYSKYPDRFQTEAIAPIQNKVGQFLSISLIRNIVGQVKSTIDIQDIIDNRKILILNLAKGRIGEDASALFGAMMITKLQMAAMQRIEIPEEERKDFYLYVDEFQNFATDAFATILSEARKYRLNLIIAHQYIEQLGDIVRAAVFGNVGTIVTFRIGAIDAEELEKEYSPYFTAEDLVNLTKYEMYLRLMIDGVASNPFSAKGLPPLDFFSQSTNNREKVIKVTRERYSKSRESVEEKIIRWTGMEMATGGEVEARKKDVPANAKPVDFPKSSGSSVSSLSRQSPASESKRASHSPDYSAGATIKAEKFFDVEKLDPKHYPYEHICQKCGQKTRTSFIPDPNKPIYCKKCLKEVRIEKAKKIQELKERKDQILNREPDNRPGISLSEVMSQKPIAFQKNTEIIKPLIADEAKQEEAIDFGSQIKIDKIDFELNKRIKSKKQSFKTPEEKSAKAESPVSFVSFPKKLNKNKPTRQKETLPSKAGGPELKRDAHRSGKLSPGEKIVLD